MKVREGIIFKDCRYGQRCVTYNVSNDQLTKREGKKFRKDNFWGEVFVLRTNTTERLSI